MTRAIPPSSANMAQMAVSCGEGLTHPGLHPRVRIEAARAVDHDREARLCGDERRQFRQEGGRVAAQALGEARGGVGGCLGHPLQA